MDRQETEFGIRTFAFDADKGFFLNGKPYPIYGTCNHQDHAGVGVAVPNTTFLRYLQPGYATVDASIGISKDNWSVELYGQNLGNSHASTFTSSAQFIQSEVPLRPRVIGVKVGAHF